MLRYEWWPMAVVVFSCIMISMLPCHSGIAFGAEPPGDLPVAGNPAPTRTSQSTNTTGTGPVSTATVPTASTAASESETEKNSQRQQRQQQRQVAISLFLLVGITLLWMLAFAIFWGRRARRIARQPLPPAPKGDELWFLKKPAPPTPPLTGTDIDRADPTRPPDTPPASEEQPH